MHLERFQTVALVYGEGYGSFFASKLWQEVGHMLLAARVSSMDAAQPEVGPSVPFSALALRTVGVLGRSESRPL